MGKKLSVPEYYFEVAPSAQTTLLYSEWFSFKWARNRVNEASIFLICSMCNVHLNTAT